MSGTGGVNRGIKSWTYRAAGNSKLVDGPAAFELWDTFGFPVDLTGLMAEEDGLAVDMPGYQAAMEAAREKSRAGGTPTRHMPRVYGSRDLMLWHTAQGFTA